MNQSMYVGIDVDDNAFSVALFNPISGELFEHKTKPNTGSLLKILEKYKEKGSDLFCCYEATYIGFTLYRDLQKNGYNIAIIAPSLVPTMPGRRVKTDRLDATKLAICLSKEELVPIHVPDVEDEADRDMIRSRFFISEQRKRQKQYILSLCRRYGIDYKGETGKKEYWTKSHHEFLIRRIGKLNSLARMNLDLLLNQLDLLTRTLLEYDEQIERLAKTSKYKHKKETLCCFRGVRTLTAMQLITEIGDVRRFKHPNKITSYSGLDIIEYSSGGKEKKFGITKMGNKYLRTAAVSVCQDVHRARYISVDLGKRRENQPAHIIKIAEKCQNRLRKKSNMLLDRGKAKNKVKVACAREFLSFVWEALYKVA